LAEIIENSLLDLTNFPAAQQFLHACLSGKYQVICYGGAIRGGKSFNGVGALTILHKLYPGSRSCIVRKDLEVLRKNTLPTCEKAIPSNFVEKFNASEYQWTFNNGSKMFFFPEGYEKDKEYKRWNGLEVNFIMMDQVEEMQLMAFEKALERVGSYFVSNATQPPPLIIITVNPTQTWIKQMMYDRWLAGDMPDGWLYIPAKMTDNPHVPDSFKESLQNLKKVNPIKYQRFVEGDWEIQDNVEGAFYKDFDYDKTVGDSEGDLSVYYDDELPLHISFDFNVNPYMTLTVYQIEITDDLKRVNQIDEFCMSSPKNTTRATCRAFASKYSEHTHGLFVYGDPSGNTEDTRSERGHNDYKIIKQELSKFKPKMRVSKAAPSVVMRGSFINTIFRNQRTKIGDVSENYRGIEIRIDSDCVNSIKDFTNLLEDADGKKMKSKKTDPVTKVRSEEFGHTSDSFDYFICEALKKDYKYYQLGDTITRDFHVPQVRNTKF